MSASDTLPKLILIADRFTDPVVARHVIEAVEAGTPWVQLRDHTSGDADFAGSATRLVGELRRRSPGVVISVNSRLLVAKAVEAGFHTGKHGPGLDEARRVLRAKWGPVGYSAHNVEEAELATGLGSDYVFASPIFPTASKPDQEGMGPEGLGRTARSVDVPVFALGGITPERVALCLEAGAYGVAVLGGILHAPDPGLATRAYLAALERLPDGQVQR